MDSPLDFLASLDESTIRAVNEGEVKRSSLTSLAEEKECPKKWGEFVHRLVRYHEDIDALIWFYCRNEQHADDGRESPAVKKVEGNHAVADLQVLYPHGPPIVTEQDMMSRLDADQLDADEWQVESGYVGHWGGQAKVGPKGAESLVYTNQFKGEVRFERKTREPQFPEPQPVHVEAPAVDPPDVEVGDSPKPEGWRTALLITDTHHGFRRHEATGDLHPLHDRHAIDLVKQVAGLADIDEVNHLGDGIDAPSISAYDNAPDLRRTLQPSLLELDYDLTQIRHAAQPDTVRYLEGNHCERIREKLLEEAEELYGLKDVDAVRENRPPQLSLRSLLRFEQKGIEWVGDYPDSEIMLNEGVSVAHDYELGSKSGHTVYKVLRDNHGEVSRIQGHGHRHERAFYTNWEGQTAKEYWAAMLGCLCRLDGIVEGVKARQNWQQSFALLHYDPNGWEHTFEPIKVYPSRTGGKRKRECYFRGSRLRSRDPDLEGLSEQTNWRFTYTDGVMA